MGAYLAFDMLGSTSWTTYSHTDKFVVEGEFGPVSYEQDTEMEIGLQEAALLYYYEECDEDERCFDLELDEEFDILVSPLTDHTIDCKDTENAEEDDMCEVDSVGSTTHSIITGGLGMLGTLTADWSLANRNGGWPTPSTLLFSVAQLFSSAD